MTTPLDHSRGFTTYPGSHPISSMNSPQTSNINSVTGKKQIPEDMPGLQMEQTSLSQREARKLSDPEERITDIIQQLSTLTSDQVSQLKLEVSEHYNLCPEQASKAVSDFLVQIQEPKSLIHGILTIACLLGAFGRQASFILDKNSSFHHIILTIIGSLATGALAVDSVTGIPENIREHWQQLPGLKKVAIASYLSLLTIATASDIYRVYSEGEKEFGTGPGIALGISEGITVFGVGAEALKVLTDLLPERHKLLDQPKANLLLIFAAAITSAGSAYAFPLGVEQWTNSLLADLAPPSLAYSPEGHTLLAGLMIPHAMVNFILETFVASSLLIGAKELLTCAVNRARGPSGQQRLDAGMDDNQPDLVHRIKMNLHHFFTGRTRKKVINTLTTAGLLSVAAMALYNIAQYQLALSSDTQNIAAGYGELASNSTLVDEQGLNAADLHTIQQWADFDAVFNRFMILNTMLVQLYGATEGLRNAAGMVLGLPVRFLNWYRGPAETAPLPRDQMRELASFLNKNHDNAGIESLLARHVQTTAEKNSRKRASDSRLPEASQTAEIQDKHSLPSSKGKGYAYHKIKSAIGHKPQEHNP